MGICIIEPGHAAPLEEAIAANLAAGGRGPASVRLQRIEVDTSEGEWRLFVDADADVFSEPVVQQVEARLLAMAPGVKRIRLLPASCDPADDAPFVLEPRTDAGAGVGTTLPWASRDEGDERADDGLEQPEDEAAYDAYMERILALAAAPPPPPVPAARNGNGKAKSNGDGGNVLLGKEIWGDPIPLKDIKED